MDYLTAKQILSDFRLDQDPESVPELAEALAYAEQFPELFQFIPLADDEFDAEFRKDLSDFEVPSHLKESILAIETHNLSEKTLIPFPKQWLHFGSFGIAAAIIALLALNFTFWKTPAEATIDNPMTDWITEAQRHLAETGPRSVGSNLAEFTQLISANGNALPREAPSSLASSKVVACDVLEIKGIKVGLICFQKDNEIFHLFSTTCTEFPEGRQINRLIVQQLKDQACVTWRENDTVYFILSKATPEKLVQTLEI